MLIPADVSPLADEGWGIVMTFDEDGYVDDDDAGSIDYTKMLREMQESAEETNEQRKSRGLRSGDAGRLGRAAALRRRRAQALLGQGARVRRLRRAHPQLQHPHPRPPRRAGAERRVADGASSRRSAPAARRCCRRWSSTTGTATPTTCPAPTRPRPTGWPDSSPAAPPPRPACSRRCGWRCWRRRSWSSGCSSAPGRWSKKLAFAEDRRSLTSPAAGCIRAPQRTAPAVEAAVVALRTQYGWAGRKLQPLLAAAATRLAPATIYRILRRHE